MMRLSRSDGWDDGRASAYEMRSRPTGELKVKNRRVRQRSKTDKLSETRGETGE